MAINSNRLVWNLPPFVEEETERSNGVRLRSEMAGACELTSQHRSPPSETVISLLLKLSLSSSTKGGRGDTATGKFFHRYILRLIIFALALFTSSCWAVIKVKGADGHWVALPSYAKRVVSLAPNITEMLFKIGAGSRVVAVSEDSDFPAAAKKLPQVGGYKFINTEVILALHPDLVVAWQGANSPADIANLRRLGLQVLVMNASDIGAVGGNMVTLGRLTHQLTHARTAAFVYQKLHHELIMKYTLQKPMIPTFVELGDMPLYAAGKKSMMQKVLTLCGARNIFEDLNVPAAQVSIGSVLKANPALIIEVGKQSLSWRRWDTLRANHDHGIFTIDPSIISRPGPRLVFGATQVCAAVARVRREEK